MEKLLQEWRNVPEFQREHVLFTLLVARREMARWMEEYESFSLIENVTSCRKEIVALDCAVRLLQEAANYQEKV